MPIAQGVSDQSGIFSAEPVFRERPAAATQFAHHDNLLPDFVNLRFDTGFTLATRPYTIKSEPEMSHDCLVSPNRLNRKSTGPVV